MAQLKLLEDKYTRDIILRLEEAKLKATKDDIVREKKIIKLKDNIKSLNQNKEKQISDTELHNRRVKAMFGI